MLRSRYPSQFRRFPITLLWWVLITGLATSPDALAKEIMKVCVQKDTNVEPLRYWCYVPSTADTNQNAKSLPMVLFLHGGGEGGTNIEKVKTHGLPKMIANGKTFPFIVVAPQNPSERQHWDDQQLLRLLDELPNDLPIDTDRVYLTGMSRGGYGAWQLAVQDPDRFAALVPVCGGGLAPYAKRLNSLPIWAFHGAKDNVIPLTESERMVRAVNQAGGDAKLTVYPDGNHNAWTATYENPELYVWLLRQSRSSRKQRDDDQ